jgi:hypothetical protein
MTEQTTDALRSAPVEAYLDSVEQALLVARVPRNERAQVLEDLTAQIADMLGAQPAPLTDDAIRAVLAQLEPPSHFAAMYTNGGENHAPAAPTSMAPQRSFRLARPEWPKVAAVCASTLVLSVLFGLMVGASGPHDFWIFMTLLTGFVGLVFTPIALYRAFKQLRATPGKYRGRNLAAGSLLIYAACMPIMLLVIASLATDGVIFYPLGLLAFAYAQYRLIQHLRHRIIPTLPADPPSPTPADQLWPNAVPAPAG